MESERILLRPVSMADAEDIYEYAQDEETGPRAGWPPHKTIEDTKKIINMWLSPDNAEKVFVIVFKPDNKVVGTIGVQKLNIKVKESKNEYVNDRIREGKILYEIGITISKPYWNKGIATEIIKMMEENIFTKLKGDEIVLTHFEANIGSKRAQEKNGYKEIYRFKSAEKWWTTDCQTTIVRSKTKEEWHSESEM